MHYSKVSLLALVLQVAFISAAAFNNGFDETFFTSQDKSFSGSPPLMHALAGKEEVIYIIMNDFKRELEDLARNKTGDFKKHAAQLSRVESYLRDFEETTGKVSGNYVVQKPLFRAAKVVWNPLASYHMIRRFAVELKRLLKTLDTDDELQRRTGNHIISIMKDFGWPSEKDLQMHMGSILRVQNVYNLNTSEIAKGKIADQDTYVVLSGMDCQEIGKVGLTNRFYTWALEWLELAAEKFVSESSPMLASLEKEIQHAIVAHDSAWERSAGWEHQYYLNKVSEVPKSRVKRRNVQFNTYKGGKTSNLNEINFWGLCDGENYQDPEEKKKLFCYLESKISDGAWAVNPIKVEVLSLHPLIVQYHDVIRDQMINKIMREAEPLLSRSTVIDETNGGRKMTHQRTSLSGWIPETVKRQFVSIPRRIELLTGLKTMQPSSAEELQVASYAFGGHYEVHMDALRLTTETMDRGDRIATFMFYLTDVEKGGSTAFPMAGVAARPVKGSAVFWNNLFSSGDPDERTWHGACPVIMGEKWVANKWIRYFDQMRTHQCKSQQPSQLDFKVNGKKLNFKQPVIARRR